MNEEYTIENVCRVLNRLPGIKVSGTTIVIKKDASLGIKAQGKIDFLVKQGYKINKVDEVKEDKSSKRSSGDFEEDKKRKRKKGIDVLGTMQKHTKFKKLK